MSKRHKLTNVDQLITSIQPPSELTNKTRIQMEAMAKEMARSHPYAPQTESNQTVYSLTLSPQKQPIYSKRWVQIAACFVLWIGVLVCMQYLKSKEEVISPSPSETPLITETPVPTVIPSPSPTVTPSSEPQVTITEHDKVHAALVSDYTAQANTEAYSYTLSFEEDIFELLFQFYSTNPLEQYSVSGIKNTAMIGTLTFTEESLSASEYDLKDCIKQLCNLFSSYKYLGLNQYDFYQHGRTLIYIISKDGEGSKNAYHTAALTCWDDDKASEEDLIFSVQDNLSSKLLTTCITLYNEDAHLPDILLGTFDDSSHTPFDAGSYSYLSFKHKELKDMYWSETVLVNTFTNADTLNGNDLDLSQPVTINKVSVSLDGNTVHTVEMIDQYLYIDEIRYLIVSPSQYRGEKLQLVDINTNDDQKELIMTFYETEFDWVSSLVVANYTNGTLHGDFIRGKEVKLSSKLTAPNSLLITHSGNLLEDCDFDLPYQYIDGTFSVIPGILTDIYPYEPMKEEEIQEQLNAGVPFDEIACGLTLYNDTKFYTKPNFSSSSLLIKKQTFALSQLILDTTNDTTDTYWDNSHWDYTYWIKIIGLETGEEGWLYYGPGITQMLPDELEEGQKLFYGERYGGS